MAKVKYTAFAPKCALPSCNNQVAYHKKTTKLNGTPAFKWKTFCTDHRTTRKQEVDDFKLATGCLNHDGKLYGFPCGSTITDACQIDVNHKDGDHHNNAPANIECLCRNCHGLVTIKQGHHQNRYNNQVKLPTDLWIDESYIDVEEQEEEFEDENN